MKIPIESFNRIKSAIHPNLRNNIEKFRKGEYYLLPSYHGCNKKNRNGTRKKINYRKGNLCVLGTEWLYWKNLKDINTDKLPYKIYLTRYGGSNYGINRLITIKSPDLWFDWDRKQFFHKRNWNIEQYLTKNTVTNLYNRETILYPKNF